MIQILIIKWIVTHIVMYVLDFHCYTIKNINTNSKRENCRFSRKFILKIMHLISLNSIN